MTILIATTNPGKAQEMRALLQADGLDAQLPHNLGITLPDVDETGGTFLENARLKAHALAQSSGYPALADDSGLCVDALGGAPGVRSARWTGPNQTDAQRTAALLEAAVHAPEAERTARFVCAVCLATPDGREATAEGTLEGVLTRQPHGTGGFGYDPVFFHPPSGMTLAELSSEAKNSLSHRAEAVRLLLPKLRELLRP